MRQEVKVMAEYYAIGTVNKSQLEEVCFESELEEAFEYSKSYKDKYDKDMNILSGYTEGVVSFEELVSSRESLDDYDKLIKFGLSVWENSNKDAFRMASISVHKFQVDMLLIEGEEEKSFDCIKDAFNKGYTLDDVNNIIGTYAKLIDKRLRK